MTLTRSGLQIRMTIFVTSAVLLVSAAALLVLAGRIRIDYENILNERIADDLTAITRSIEQRMLRLEDATNTMASLASFQLDGGYDIDSVLCRTVESIGGVRGVSVIFREGLIPGVDGYYERRACLDADGKVRLDTIIRGEECGTHYSWVSSYDYGQPGWSEPSKDFYNGADILCYVVPQNNAEGERIGVAYAWFLLSEVTSFVTNYKVRKDIDISVYTAKGTMVIAPDDYILETAPEDLIVRKSTLDHFGWDVILSADRSVIEHEVRHSVASTAVLMLLMFLLMSLAIGAAVRYVAKPFVLHQHSIEKEKALLDNEMALASGAQNELLPHVFPPFPDRKGIDLCACLHPARDVGGDLYDYFIEGDHLFFCIGDVSGKGVQASLFMAATHYLFRSMAVSMPVAAAARQMNVSLCANNEKCRFVTFWFGCLDLCSGALEYVNAGHDAPVFVRNGRVEEFPGSDNMPFGAFDEAEFASDTITLASGDMLLLYTDGVTEAMDVNRREFGRQRLSEVVDAAAGADASGVIDAVLGQVRAHASGAEQSDDITMLCLKFIKEESKF